jgi:hypothetical protein
MEEKMKGGEDEVSVLEGKLNDMTDLITKAGGAAGILTVAILLFRFAMGFMNQECCKEVRMRVLACGHARAPWILNISCGCNWKA